jgi:hypothetical protein
VRGESVANGLGGRLLTRPSPRGGCGNEFILTVFRMVFPALLIPDTARGCGKAEVGAGVAGGRKVEVDGARSPLFGVFAPDFLLGELEIPPVLFLVLVTGRAGNATVGGPFDGRDGRGSVVAISVKCIGRISQGKRISSMLSLL